MNKDLGRNGEIDPSGDHSHNISDKENKISTEEVIGLLDKIIYSKPPLYELPKGVYYYERLPEILLDLLVVRQFVVAMANGNLSVRLNMKGYIGGALKMLQANLNHLTWQAQMIASGDFSQRVDFMGDFAKAFNEMVVKLDDTLRALKQKETDLTTTNLALVKEIEIREEIEQSLRESEERYKTLAQIDPLTGIYNRRHFFMLAETETLRAFRYSHPLSILMLDIDYFKKINDGYGHLVGDKVLQETAKTTRAGLRTIDILARYGGEEFIMLLPETGLEGAIIVAERLRKMIQNSPIDSGDQIPISITVSIGVCSSTINAPEKAVLEDIINRADQSLYEAKKSGRNRVCYSNHLI